MLTKEKLYIEVGMSIEQLREFCANHLNRVEMYLTTYPWHREFDLNKSACLNFIEEIIFNTPAEEYIDNIYESKNTTHDEENLYIWFRDAQTNIHTTAVEYLANIIKR